MGNLVSYDLEDSIASLTMDDGKVNALSLEMLGQLNGALDRAASTRRSRHRAHRPGGRLLGRLRPEGASGRGHRRAGHAPRRLRAGRTPPVVPDAGTHRLQWTRGGHGRLPLVVGRLPHWHRRRIPDHRQRGGHRTDHAPGGDRDLPATARPRPFQPGGHPGRGVLTRRGSHRRGLGPRRATARTPNPHESRGRPARHARCPLPTRRPSGAPGPRPSGPSGRPSRPTMPRSALLVDQRLVAGRGARQPAAGCLRRAVVDGHDEKACPVQAALWDASRRTVVVGEPGPGPHASSSFAARPAPATSPARTAGGLDVGRRQSDPVSARKVLDPVRLGGRGSSGSGCSSTRLFIDLGRPNGTVPSGSRAARCRGRLRRQTNRAIATANGKGGHSCPGCPRWHTQVGRGRERVGGPAPGNCRVPSCWTGRGPTDGGVSLYTRPGVPTA